MGHTNNKKNSKINRVLNTEHLEGNKQNLICHHAVPGEWRILLYNWTLYSSYHQLYRLIKINHTIIFKIVICRIAWIIKIMICNLTCIMIRMKIILMSTWIIKMILAFGGSPTTHFGKVQIGIHMHRKKIFGHKCVCFFKRVVFFDIDTKCTAVIKQIYIIPWFGRMAR